MHAAPRMRDARRRGRLVWLALAELQSANFREVAVATEAVLETGRAADAVDDQRFAPVVPFLNQRIAHGEAVTLDGGAAIGAHAHLREPRNLLRQLFGFAAGAAFWGDIFA